MKKITMTLALGAAMLAGGQAVQAAPVAPSQANIQGLWQFNETVGTQGNAGYGTPDEMGGPSLGAGRLQSDPNVNYPIQLVGAGDSLALNGGGSTTSYSPTPFNFSGNKSAVVDWHGPITGQENYPQDRYNLGAVLPTADYSISSEGAVSFWYNPIFHEQGEPAESYLFALRNQGTGERLVARVDRTQDGVNSGMISTGSTGGVTNQDLVVSDWGFSYNGSTVPNGSAGDEWYNIIVTWGADGLDVYNNGVLIASNSFVVNGFDLDRLFVGSYSGGGSHAPGLYDEFTIWNSKLTADNAEWLAANSINDLQVTSVIPEPATAALGLMGLGGLLVASRRRRAC